MKSKRKLNEEVGYEDKGEEKGMEGRAEEEKK